MKQNEIYLVAVQQENILKVRLDSPADLTLAKIDEEFKDVFKCQGCRQAGKLHLEVHRSVTTATNPPRRVLFAVEETLKSELALRSYRGYAKCRNRPTGFQVWW